VSKSNSSKDTLSVPAEEQMDDVYYNEGPVGTKMSETSILVEELKNYVDKITRNDNNLEKEYKVCTCIKNRPDIGNDWLFTKCSRKIIIGCNWFEHYFNFNFFRQRRY
jgi:hypothetical protein